MGLAWKKEKIALGLSLLRSGEFSHLVSPKMPQVLCGAQNKQNETPSKCDFESDLIILFHALSSTGLRIELAQLQKSHPTVLE